MPAQDRPPAKIRVELRIHCGDARLCQAMRAAIAPDDREAPEWLRIREAIEDSALKVSVEVEGLRLLSLRNTVDEIIEYLYSLLKSLEKLEADEELSRSPS